MLANLFINSLFIIGLYEAAEPGRILAPLHDFLEEKAPDWIYKPLIGCVYCMASFWGLVFFFSMAYFDGGSFSNFYARLWFLPFYLLALSGLNYLLYDLILFLRR